MRNKCVMLGAVVTVYLILSATPAFGQMETSNLLEQRISLHLKQATFLYALSTLCTDARIPIGIELGFAHKNEYHLDIDANNATLREILNRIIQQQPDYKWELRDGVINITPSTSRDELVEKFLNTSVRRFNPPKVLGKFLIRDAIVELPEVADLLKANGINASHYGYPYQFPSGYTNDKVDLSISGADVRGVLNKVIRESEYKMWMVSRSGNNLSSLDVSF